MHSWREMFPSRKLLPVSVFQLLKAVEQSARYAVAAQHIHSDSKHACTVLPTSGIQVRYIVPHIGADAVALTKLRCLGSLSTAGLVDPQIPKIGKRWPQSLIAGFTL